ncbi:hypothetical protein H1R20_g10365, partial [Candolleomyces eurysporus]
MLKDITSIPGCLHYFLLYLLLNLLSACLPALSLWYSGQLLIMVEKAVEERTVDRSDLLRVAAGRVAATIAQRLLADVTDHVLKHLNVQIERYYALRAFRTLAMLDYPTFSDKSTQDQFSAFTFNGYSEMNWHVFTNFINMGSIAVRTATQFAVLLSVFQGHQEAWFLLAITCARLAVDAIATSYSPLAAVYAFKSNDEDYVVSEGLKLMGLTENCRKDIIAGGLGDYLWQEYRRRLQRLGNKSTNQYELLGTRNLRWYTRLCDYARDPVDALTQVYTCLRFVDSPASVPFSLANLELINSTITSLTFGMRSLGAQVDGISTQIDKVRRFYELLELTNKIEDGHIPFPENQMDLSQGISVEFKNVSFSYSDSDKSELALKNASFKIEQGQLCVIVGENGSGKSTILNLITRIYDVTEGEILLNGLDIRTLKLADVRKAIAVLFQEYSIFPLTLGQNIGYGDPQHAEDMDKIEQAAKLGGAEFISNLPCKFDHFVQRPVWEYSSADPTRNSVFAGKEVDFSKLKLNDQMRDFSGGQKQRIALSRTFMKSLVSPSSNVGMLLFDEPSASLDPKAEHDLFTRLRELRGSKTMIFSSHRFGKLTRHADLILYIDKGEVLEAGNHVNLMKKNGEYAKFWNLQAQDFL